MDRGDRWLYGWALGYAAAGAASLLIPLYALSLGGGAFIVGVLASTAAFAGVPGALLWGWLASRTGRRRVFVLFALAATAVVMAVTPLLRTAWPLVAANALLWFVMSAASPVLNLLVVDGAPRDQWEPRIALLNTYQGYGWVAGLVLGSVWTPIGARLFETGLAQRSLFWVCAIAAGAAVPLAVRWLPRETTVRPEQLDRARFLERLDRGAGRYVRTVPFATTRLYWGLRRLRAGPIRGLLSRFPPTLWFYLGAVTLFSVGFAAFWGPLPAYLSVSYADEQVFWFFLATNVASTAFYTPAGRWALRRSARSLQAGALVVRGFLFPLVGTLTILAAPTLELPLLLVTFAAIGLTWAVIAVTATAIVARLAGDARGEALGVFTAVAGVGGGIGSVFGGLLASTASYLIAFGLAGATVLVSVVGILLLHLETGDSG